MTLNTNTKTMIYLNFNQLVILQFANYFIIPLNFLIPGIKLVSLEVRYVIY